jgi:hypothetical protein
MRLRRTLALIVLVAVASPVGTPRAIAGTVAGDTDSLTLSSPGVTAYGHVVTIRGALAPGKPGISVDLVKGGGIVNNTQTSTDGSFSFVLRLQDPGPYVARSGSVQSAPVTARIKPSLRASIKGARIVGQRLIVRGRLRPSRAGKLRLVVRRGRHRVVRRLFAPGKRMEFAVSKVRRHVARVEVVPRNGYVKVVRKFRFSIKAPALHQGSRGAAVHLLERELAAHRFALSNTDSVFGYDTLEAVYALQKLYGLPRTGRMSASAWLALSRSRLPRPRLHGSYVDVNKTKQVLFIVRKSKVRLIVPVSTGATGNTPIGIFHVYSKVPGGAVMYYSNYFIGAFAIHGYVDVPPWPASHGCVRVPMCFAIRLYGLIPMHSRVYIHY